MAEVKELRVNRVELKLGDTDDPLASKVSWQPLVRGGSNFRTHRLRETPGRLQVRRTIGRLVFGCVFAVPGTIPVLKPHSPSVSCTFSIGFVPRPEPPTPNARQTRLAKGTRHRTNSAIFRARICCLFIPGQRRLAVGQKDVPRF